MNKAAYTGYVAGRVNRDGGRRRVYVEPATKASSWQGNPVNRCQGEQDEVTGDKGVGEVGRTGTGKQLTGCKNAP